MINPSRTLDNQHVFVAWLNRLWLVLNLESQFFFYEFDLLEVSVLSVCDFFNCFQFYGIVSIRYPSWLEILNIPGSFKTGSLFVQEAW